MSVTNQGQPPESPSGNNAPDTVADIELGEGTARAAPAGDDGGVASFKEFEAAQAAAVAAGEPDLFKSPDAKPAAAEDKPASAAAGDKPAEKPAGEKPKLSARERINQLSRKAGDSERIAQAEKERADRLEAELAEVRAGRAPAAAEPVEDAAPGPDDKNADGTEKYPFGELDSKYVRDLAKHEARQIVREERTRGEQERQQQAAQAQAAEVEEAWATQLESAAAEIPDFVDKVIRGGEAKAWPCSEDVAAMLVTSEVGAKIAYHLATNLREAVALDKITDPVERARSFGRLEARFEKSASPTPARQARLPQADAPIEQPRGSGGKFEPNDGTADFKAFEAKWQPVVSKNL